MLLELSEARYQYIGDFFKAVRKKHGISQEQLAELTGVSMRHISNMERGLVNPSCDLVRRLLQYIPTDISLLFYQDSRDAQEDTDEREMLEILRRCSPDDRKKLIKIARCFLKDGTGNTILNKNQNDE